MSTKATAAAQLVCCASPGYHGRPLAGTRCSPFITRAPSAQALLNMYIQVMKASNCTAPAPLYVASGLLTYMNASGGLLQLCISAHH